MSAKKGWLKRLGARARSIGCAAAMAWGALGGPAFADEATALRSINLVEMTNVPTSSVVTYYAQSAVGWGAASCPSATWAYMYGDRLGAKESFALLLWAKQMGKQVQLVGTCASPGYFIITVVIVAD